MGRTATKPIGALGDNLIEDMARTLSGLSASIKSTPTPVTKEADVEAKKEQEDRSKKYGIAVKDNGNVTKPSEWKSVPDEDFLDPVNYSYPCPTADQTVAAARYWGKDSNRSVYSSEEQAIITKRLEDKKKKFGIGEDKDVEPVSSIATPEDKKDSDLGSNMGGRVDGPDFEGNIPAEADQNDEAIEAAESHNDDDDEDDQPIVVSDASQEDELSNPLDTASDNNISTTSTGTDLPNEVEGKYEELTEEQVSGEDTDDLQKVASTEPDEAKKGSKLNRENREMLSQIQALLAKISGEEPEPEPEKATEPESTVVLREAEEKIKGLTDLLVSKEQTLQSQLAEIGELKSELETKTKSLEELETTVSTVGQTVTLLETKFAEFQEKVGKISELDTQIETKTKEYERITKTPLPRPDEAKPEVVVRELLGTNKARKSFVGLTNAELLTLDPIK